MTRAFGILALTATLAVSAPAAAGSVSGMGASPEAIRAALREHVLRTLDGRTLTLGSLRGHVVLINFWASWCPPCRRELPALAAAAPALTRAGVRVLTVSVDQDVRNVRRFVADRGLSLLIAHDGPDGLARRLDLEHVPFTMLLDQNGEVASIVSGGDLKAFSQLEVRARELAGGPAAGVVRTTEGATP